MVWDSSVPRMLILTLYYVSHRKEEKNTKQNINGYNLSFDKIIQFVF